MWSHYANSHTGFVIGFDKNGLHSDTKCTFSDIIYDDSFPLVDLFGDAVESVIRPLITKSKTHWEYENEYRLIKFNFSREKLVLDKATLKELVLGCKMAKTEKDFIIDYVRGNLSHMKIYESVLSKSKFETELLQIF